MTGTCKHGRALESDGLPAIGDACWSESVESGVAVVDVMRPTLTLVEMLDAASEAGVRAKIVDAGGNVRALTVRWGGAEMLFSLGDGTDCGTDWSVSLDGVTRLKHGEASAEGVPVTSDAAQTLADALGWLRHCMWGEPLADGDRDHE